MTTELEQAKQANARLLEKRRAMSTKKTTVPKIGQVICLPSVAEGKQESAGDMPTCEKHGCNMEEFSGRWFCPMCAEDAREQEQQWLEEQEREARKARRQAEFDKRFAAVMIGKRFQDQTWNDYRPTCKAAAQIKRSCRDIGREFSRHLELGTNWLFVGRCGTGKNMLSALIAREVVGEGFTALHTTAAKLVRRVRSTWGGHGSEEEAIEQFVQPDLLIIDEVGVQAGSDTEQRLLTEVINDRYEAMRPTICISNHTVKELEDYLGVRAMDRFYEGESKVLVFDWESWRRRPGPSRPV